jgi:hypothetical protein
MWESIQTWFFSLGAEYGVDPIIFGAIYVGAIPFFTASLAWLVRNLRQKKPASLPAFLTGFFFLSAYLYLLAVGQNIPWWVYGAILALIAFGAYSTIRKIRARVRSEE